MDLAKLKQIAPALDGEITTVFAKYGLKVDRRSASTDPTTGVVRYTLTLRDTNAKDSRGNATNPDIERYKYNHVLLNLPADGVGRTFTNGGKTFKVAGMRDGKSVNCIVATREPDGKRFVFHPDDVKVKLANAAFQADKSSSELAGLKRVTSRV